VVGRFLDRIDLDAINGPYTQGIAGQTDFDFTNLTNWPHKVYIKMLVVVQLS
jgi:hypothetical protein